METSKFETLKILIVEDEPLLALSIQEKLNNLGYSQVFIANNSDKALSHFEKFKPDLVLMDINLGKSSLDGVDVAKKFNDILKIPIIYLSANSEGNLYKRALDTNPANFLEKNYTDKQLGICIDVAIKNFSTQTASNSEHVYEKKGLSYAKKTVNTQIQFHTIHNQVKVVAIEDVVYCVSDGDSSKIFLKNYKGNVNNEPHYDIYAYRNLGYYETFLNQEKGFVRIHNQILLNVSYIDTYHYGECKIFLKNGRTIIAARRGITKLRDYFNGLQGLNTEG